MHAAAFSAGQLAVVRNVYYNRLSVMYTRTVKGIICAAGPCASQDLAPKFAMKPSATVTPCWEGVVRRGEATHLP